MQELVRKLRVLSGYCNNLAQNVLDRGMKAKFIEAARFFADEAEEMEAASKRQPPSSGQRR